MQGRDTVDETSPNLTPYSSVGYSGQQQEIYSYNADGFLIRIDVAETGYIDNGNGTVTPTSVL